MNRSDLVERLAQSAGISNRDAELVVSAMLDRIGAGLAEGHRVELRGFGVFERRQRPERQARNPRTGEPVMAPERATVHFRAGRGMLELLNGDAGARAALQTKRDVAIRRRDEKAGQLTLL